MKKLFLVAGSLMLSSCLWASGQGQVWRSSFTATVEATQNLCVNRRGFFHGVVVSSAVTNSSINIYASSGTVDSPIALIDATGEASYFYDVVAISTNTNHTGLTYSKIGTSALTILYDCY